MKTTFRFIIAAMAAIAVFSSCQKELANEIANKTTDGVRTISVQFDNSTKATLDGFTPKFEENDAIRVSNNTTSEVCTLSVTGTFTTTLSGELTAIYPADAAVLSTGEADAPIATSDNIKVSASQDGDVAKAINTEGQTDDAKCVITVSNSDSTTFYVALVPNVNLSDLSFEYTTDETHGAMKGISINAIKAQEKADKTEANYKYIIDEKGWHPYVKIGNLKWATENIGATDTNPYGTYFAWGDVVGYVPSGSTFSTSFDWAHAPFNNGQSTYDKTYFASVKDSECPNGILALKNDAANVNWGGSWRMPTQPEFDALGSATKVTSPGDGRQFGTSPNMIFLPAAGIGADTNLGDTEDGHYWLSSVGIDMFKSPNDKAYSLYFYQETALTAATYDRCYGMLVRALSE